MNFCVHFSNRFVYLTLIVSVINGQKEPTGANVENDNLFYLKSDVYVIFYIAFIMQKKSCLTIQQICYNCDNFRD